MRIILVEDDLALAEALSESFDKVEVFCDIASTAQAAEELLANYSFDAVILDLGLPDDNGLNLLHRIRAKGDDTPVIILAAQSQAMARIHGLERGADDYLGKPFLFAELRARLNAVLRRADGRVRSVMSIGNLEFDLKERTAVLAGKPLLLTPRERAILELLVRRPDRIATRKLLEDQLFGSNEELGSNAVEVYIHRLRSKLVKAGTTVNIETIRGVGYVLRDVS